MNPEVGAFDFHLGRLTRRNIDDAVSSSKTHRLGKKSRQSHSGNLRQVNALINDDF
jgi:hypothetical protein